MRIGRDLTRARREADDKARRLGGVWYVYGASQIGFWVEPEPRTFELPVYTVFRKDQTPHA